MKKMLKGLMMVVVALAGILLAASISSANNVEISPFGINNPYEEDEEGNLPGETSVLLKDLDVDWVSDSILRREVEIKPLVYDWSSVDNKIQEYKKEAGLKILFVINPKSNYQHGDGRQLNQTYLPDGPQSLAACEDYVTKLIVRYEGKVERWMVFNEPFLEYKDNIDDYVELVVRTYRIIKSIDPQAQVVLGGVGGGQKLDFHRQVEDSLRENYPEIASDLWFDYHTYSWNYRDYNIKKVIRKNVDGKPNTECEVLFTKTHKDHADLLRDVGWSEEEINTKVINKEGATHTEEFNDQEQPYWCYPAQTESQQAEFLFKRAIDQASNKVRMIMWSTLGKKENIYGDSDSRFTGTGLIHYDTNVKKLSYYTYKFLIRNLKGSDFDSVNVMETYIPNVYLYEFQKPDGPLYVLWWNYWAEGESGESKQVTIVLPNITASNSKVKITEAIPNFPYDYQTEDEKLSERDYPNFFNNWSEFMASNSVTISLGRKPLFIEGILESSLSIIYPRDQEVFSPNSRVEIIVEPLNSDDVRQVGIYVNGKRHQGKWDRKTGRYYYFWRIPDGFSQEYVVWAESLGRKRKLIAKSDSISVFTSDPPLLHISVNQDTFTATTRKDKSVVIAAQFSPSNAGIYKLKFFARESGNLKRTIGHVVYRSDSQGFYVWKMLRRPGNSYEVWAEGYTRSEKVVESEITRVDGE